MTIMTYIAFEGLKGSGKSTVLKEVYQYLNEQDIEYHLFNITKAGDLNHELEKQALDPLQRESDDFNKQLYHYRALYHYQSLLDQQVDPHKDLIVGDRSIITAVVTRWHMVNHQINRHQDYINDLLREQNVFIPDYVFYLDITIDEVLKRQAYRRSHEGRNYGLHEETKDSLEKVLQAYHFLIDQTPQQFKNIKWIKINANQTLTKVVQDVIHEIQKIHHLPRKKLV